jgi:4-hydroxy-tetrahydrodipicolinate reductase
MGRIRVIVTGACGKMGRVTLKTILSTPTLKLVGAVDPKNIGIDVGELVEHKEVGVTITSELPVIKEGYDPIVVVDFTREEVAYENIKKCMEYGYYGVIGTTMSDEELFYEIRSEIEKSGIAVLIAPNFAIGAVLMMRFAKIAAKYMETSEILEQHHDKKLDAPPGTALMTAQIISEVQRNSTKGKNRERLKIHGVRGGNLDGVPIHSMRLPGFLSHHTVIFGDIGQRLTLKHDSII